MKNKILLPLVVTLCLSSVVQARCIGPVVNGKCLGTEIYDNSNNNSSYESNSGTKYEYDLNDIRDRNSYSTDTDAQLRDSLNTNPRRQMDRDMGQHGGGIYD